MLKLIKFENNQKYTNMLNLHAFLHFVGILYNILYSKIHKESKGLVMLQLTSCSKKDYWLCLCSLIHDNLKRAWIWLIAATFYCSDNCCSMTKPFPILQMLGCERLTTNIRRMVLANKINAVPLSDLVNQLLSWL